jgi:tetratricopeptide (TPR) repeat protein
MLRDETGGRAATRRVAGWVVAAAVVAGVASGVAYWQLSQRTAEELLAVGLANLDKDPGEAERLLRKAAASPEAPHDARLALALVLARRGDWNDATDLLASTNLSQCRGDLLVKFGQEALRAGRLEETAAALEPASRDRAAGDDRASVVALRGLVATYGKLNRQDDLIDAAGRLARKEPADPANWQNYIQLLKAAHRQPERLAAVQEALAHQPPREIEIEFRYQLIDQLMINGDSAPAWKEIETIQAAEGDSLRLATKKIDLYRLDGRLGEALAAIEAVFPAISHMNVARLTRGAVYLDVGRYEDARRDLELAIAAEPYNEGAHFKLSQAYRLLGDEERAKRHVEINLDIRKKRIRINELLKEQDAGQLDPALCRELADLYAALGELPAAENWRRQAMLVGK